MPDLRMRRSLQDYPLPSPPSGCATSLKVRMRTHESGLPSPPFSQHRAMLACSSTKSFKLRIKMLCLKIKKLIISVALLI